MPRRYAVDPFQQSAPMSSYPVHRSIPPTQGTVPTPLLFPGYPGLNPKKARAPIGPRPFRSFADSHPVLIFFLSGRGNLGLGVEILCPTGQGPRSRHLTRGRYFSPTLHPAPFSRPVLRLCRRVPTDPGPSRITHPLTLCRNAACCGL